MSQSTWTQNDVEQLLSLRASGYSCADVATMLRRTEAHVRSKLLAMGYSTRRLDRPVAEAPVEDRDEKISPLLEKATVAVDRALQRQQEQKDLESAKRMVLEDRIVSVLATHWEKSPPCNIRPSLSPVSKPIEANASAVCLVGDLHMGKVVDPREVPLPGAYHPALAVARVAHLEQQWTTALQQRPVEKLYVVFLGDMVEGHLGHVVQDNLTLPIACQFDLALSVLTQFLIRLAACAPETHVYGVTGNHGRMFGERKMPASGRWNNFDGLLYRAIYSWMAANGADHIHCHRTIESRLRIPTNHHVIQAMHGDEVRGGAFASTGLNREYLYSAMRGYHTKSTPPDIIVMGDKHISAQLPIGPGCCVINGSFVGVDAFGMGFPPSRPSQSMLRLGQTSQETQVVMLDTLPEDMEIPYEFTPDLKNILNAYEHNTYN